MYFGASAPEVGWFHVGLRAGKPRMDGSGAATRQVNAVPQVQIHYWRQGWLQSWMVPRVPYFGAGAHRVNGCFHKLAVKGTLFRFTEGLLQFSMHALLNRKVGGGGGGGLGVAQKTRVPNRKLKL